jgi:hypothetical protein
VSTALIKSDLNYRALSPQGASDLQDLLDDHFGGKMPPVHKLDHVAIPTGGNIMWDIPGFDKPQESFSGVILHRQPNRQLYRNPFGKGPKEAPICSSKDGIIGIGDPGGSCEDCPKSKFGPNNERPECPDKEDVYILRPNGLLPSILSLPSTSLKALTDYGMRLFNQGQFLYGVETTFSLERKQSKGGVNYSTLKLAQAPTVISEEDRARFKAMKADIVAYLRRQVAEE